MKIDHKFIEKNLLSVLSEMKAQPDVQRYFPENILSYEDQIDLIEEYLVVAGEYGLAYEDMISLLELYPFVLSGHTAVKLLEIGLIFKYKTDDPKDSRFDSRDKSKFGG